MQKIVHIDGSKIISWDTFHDQFSEVLGFPGLYGRNMNAWNDCMTYVDSPDEALSSVHVSQGEVMVLCISDVEALRSRCREIYDALVECSAFVNWRRIEKGESAVLALSFYS